MDSVLLTKTNLGLKVDASVTNPVIVVIKSELDGKCEYNHSTINSDRSYVIDYSSDVWKLGAVKAYLFPVDLAVYKALRQGEHKTPPKGKPGQRSAYAVPETYSFPIHDAAHVRAAEAYFNRHKFRDHAQRQSAASRILRAAKKFGVVVSPQSVVARAAKGDHVIEKTEPWGKAYTEPYFLPSCKFCKGPLTKEGRNYYYCMNCECHYLI